MDHYRVIIYEAADSDEPLTFYCQADDKEHAVEQALDKYSDHEFEVVVAMKLGTSDIMSRRLGENK